MKRFVFFGALMLISTLSFSQPCENCNNHAKTLRYKNYFGVGAGHTTGNGLSYRRWLNNQWGLQVNFAPYYKTSLHHSDYHDWYKKYQNTYGTPESGTFNFGSVSLGITALRSIVENRFFRALLYTGVNTFGDYKNFDFYSIYPHYDTNNNPIGRYKGHVVIHELNDKITLGGGGGFELYAWRFSFNVMAGLHTGITLPQKKPELLPSAECGIHFMF